MSTPPARSNPARHKERMRLARKVAYQADQELRRLHVEEWEEIYIRLSEQAGLSPVTIRMRQRLRTGVDDGREA